ncbi:MAG: pyridoxal-phosphate dependent enzyme [Candidatus Bathyarchaeota archaeon]|nr:MAG: pyridoxal-phosphate dependent enzyme [Candidatus Bathyarchaeota archaeon]
MNEEVVNFQNILEASKKIRDIVARTPTYYSVVFSQRTGAKVYLKLEGFQPVGVFKIRGAANKICNISKPDLEKGLVTASSGNHGLSVAYVANIVGAKAIVVVPKKAVKEKVEAIESYGAQVVEYGKDYEEAYAKALEMREKTEMILVHPFNDSFVIAGQGTIGLELLEDIPDLDTIIVPIGGGGLISGIAIAAKTLKPDIRIVGVQAERAPAIYRSWRAGEIVETESFRTVADGLVTRKPLDLTFRIIKKHVDEILLVTEQEIGESVLALLREAHVLAEPSAATSLAALLFKYSPKRREKVAIIISGANISLVYLQSLLRKQNGLSLNWQLGAKRRYERKIKRKHKFYFSGSSSYKSLS